MISNENEGKGIIAVLLEKCIEIYLKKECNKIKKININIFSSTIKIIKGLINKITIIAEGINYKDLIFDEIKLEAKDVKIVFKIQDKELKFKNNFTINFKILLSENSLKEILLSNNWNWIGKKISKQLLNLDKLEDIKINNNQILMKGQKSTNSINEAEKVKITAEKGKIYLKSKSYNKSINIPIEEKVYISNIYIHENSIIFDGNSSIDF